MIGAIPVADSVDRDNSTALLFIAMQVTILNLSSSETEKMVLYQILEEAAVEMPEVMAMV